MGAIAVATLTAVFLMLALAVSAGQPAFAQGAATPPAGDTAPAGAAPSGSDPAAAPAPLPAIPAEAPADPTLPHDLTPWGMFMAADWVVKAVMIGLAFASVLSWTIWLAKSLELVGARRRAARGLQVLARAASLREGAEKLTRSSGAVAGFARAAMHELNVSADVPNKDGIKERVASRLDRIKQAAGRRMQRGTGILATIGATAPFVGLFGTVWGIMNSFIGISKA